MKKEKKVLIGLITLVLLVSAISIPPVLSHTSKKIQSVPNFQPDYTQYLTKEKVTGDWIHSYKTDSSNPKNRVQLGTDIQVSPFLENDAHPALAIDGDGNPFIAYDHETEDLNTELYFQRSFDRGNTWPEDEIIFISSEEISPIKPTVDITADGARGLATFENNLEEPVLYFLDALDINDPGSWALYYFDMSGDTPFVLGTAIAAYGTNTGVLACIRDVTSSASGETFEEKCLVLWANDLDGDTWSNVFWGIEAPMSKPDVATGGDRIYAACEVNDIDRTHILTMYAPYDTPDYSGWRGSQIVRGSSNLTNPQLAISGTNRYCVVENDINGNKDILCYKQTGSMWRRYTVVDTPEDEMYPAITADGDTVTVTFIKNGNLYMSKSEDKGSTWSEPTQVNDEEGTVVGDHRNADMKGPYMAWTDNRNDNTDIYFDIGTAPLVGIPAVSGGFGVTATIENTGTADATDVEWSINVDAPLLLIGGEANGTIPILPAGNSETVKSGFLLGIGKGTITITADDAETTASGFILGPLVLNVQ